MTTAVAGSKGQLYGNGIVGRDTREHGSNFPEAMASGAL